LDDEEEIDKNKKNYNFNKDNNNIITSEIIKDLDKEAKNYNQNNKNENIEITVDDYKKLIELENTKEEEEYLEKFLVKNKQNEIEFFEDQKGKLVKEFEDKNQYVDGWGSWAGDSKTIQNKDFLRKKRQEQRINQFKNNLKLSKIIMNNSIDKKSQNFMVNELPYPFKNTDDYSKLYNNPLGLEWNSLTMYKNLIKPKIVKKIGQIIEPMKINDSTTAKKICDIIDKNAKKKNKPKANF